MKRIAPLWKSAVFAMVTTVSLGFGAAQAFAAPRAPAENERACTNSYCSKVCGTLGGNWVPAAGKCYCCG